MKSNIIALFALFFFLAAGSTATAATANLSMTNLKSLHADQMCAEDDEQKKKKKKVEEEEEPECD